MSAISKSQGFWSSLFKGLGIYLALELGSFLIAGAVFKKTMGEMAGPYIAFALPGAILMPVAWWLRKWEEKGAAPKRLARGWALMMVLFVIATTAAVFYSGVQFGFIDRSNVIFDFVTATVFGCCVGYFGMYHNVLRIISERKAGASSSPSIGEAE